MDAQRALLEELMRPHIPGSRKFTDKDVCKNMLVAFCPNELFTNTKSNLGHCNLFHDEMLQNDYRNSPDFQKLGYEQTFYAYLQQLVNDVERSIRRNKERLDVKPPLNEDEKQERMILLEEKIKALLNEMEKVGEEGKIDEATKLDAEAERLKQELEAVKLGLPGKYEKRMEVCDICGALLVMGDSKDRIESHMTGKQHTGFQLIRDTLEEHKKRGGGFGGGGRRDSRGGGWGRDRDERDRSRSPQGRGERGGRGYIDDYGRRRDSKDSDRNGDRDRDRDRRGSNGERDRRGGSGRDRYRD